MAKRVGRSTATPRTKRLPAKSGHPAPDDAARVKAGLAGRQPARKPAPATTGKTNATAPVARAATAATNEDIQTMTDTMKKTTDKAQTMMADMNDRAKSAMEKSTKMFEEMNDFARGNVEAVVESSKIATKGFEAMGRDAADYGRKSFENATAAMKSFAGVKSPTEFFKLQSDYVRSAFDSMVAETSKSTENMLKLAGDVAQPLSNRAAVAADKVKVSA